MNRDQVYISGSRYSSEALHRDAHWRHVRDLGKQAKGCYTATVDGKQGVITIDATGWWFTELTLHKTTDRQKSEDAEVLNVPAFLRGPSPLQLRNQLATALLREWLDIDNWENEAIAPRVLVDRTRAFIAHTDADSVSPAKTMEAP